MTYKKTPKAAEWGVFEEIDEYNKKNHPTQYFFRDRIPDWFSYKKFWLHNKYWEFKHKYIPKYNYSKCPTGLDPKGYYDIVELMVHVNFTFLERFVDKEKCFEYIKWYGEGCEREFVASEIEDLYYWWKNIRPKRTKIADKLYAQVSKHTIGKATEKDKKIYDELNKLEIFWGDEDDYNLKRLVSLRRWLWT